MLRILTYKIFFRVFLLLFISLAISMNAFSQESNSPKAFTPPKHRVTLYGGMGISILDNTSFNNYLRREIPFTNNDTVHNFNTGIEFFGGIEFGVSKNISIKLDYSYYMRSIGYVAPPFEYNYNIVMHQPYLIASYVISNKSYDLKFGLGAGYHIGTVEKEFSQTNGIKYKSAGPSFRFEGVFAPYLSKKLQAYVSGFVVASVYSSLKDSGGHFLYSSNSVEEVNLGSFGAGARIGFSYLIH